MHSAFSGYQSGGSISSPSQGSQSDRKEGKYWSLDRLKRSYLDYLGSKREEIDEQQESRRYRHGSQWTSDEVKQLNARKQPIVTNNKISRKIHGIVGTLARLKQDPKAYARTPKHEKGAELATAVLRYVIDEQEFDTKDPLCAERAAIDGYAGLELNLAEGDRGDHEVELELVDTEDFFYDPRSFHHDFSDARYMGVGKWLDVEAAIELFPDKESEIYTSLEAGEELTTESDREQRWFIADGDIRRVRIVECWYKYQGEWVYSIFTGSLKLMEGKSYLINEKGKTECKYLMFSAYVDQDGDRYGLVRDMKPLNREVNMRRSKALYTMLSRRMRAEQGAFDDVEVARREAARADGVVIYNKGFEMDFDDTARMAETEAQFKFLEDVKSDLEAIGPNIAVTGEGLENSSGRAIHLLQQAGLADLGPFIQSYRGWKIRVYRAIWNAVQRHWSGERWVRVTDDDDIAEYIQINGVGIDPQTGMPTMINSIGSLDVDIILDEGPDSVNIMGDAYDTLSIMAGKGTEIPPDILLELAPLPISLKKRLLEKLNPSEPNPELEFRKQLENRHAMAEISEREASAKLKEAQALKAIADAQAEASGNLENAKIQQQQIEADIKLRNAEMEHEQAMRHKEEEHRISLETKRMDMALAAESKSQDMELRKAERNDLDERRNNEKIARQKDSSSIKEFAEIFDRSQRDNKEFMAGLIKELRRPKKLVRGKDGRIATVE